MKIKGFGVGYHSITLWCEDCGDWQNVSAANAESLAVIYSLKRLISYLKI